MIAIADIRCQITILGTGVNSTITFSVQRGWLTVEKNLVFGNQLMKWKNEVLH
jgi:hypothetical protein